MLQLLVLFLCFVSAVSVHRAYAAASPTLSPRAPIDWTPFMPTAKTQGPCSTSVVMALTAATEAMWNIKNNLVTSGTKMKSLSSQAILDCTPNTILKADCNALSITANRGFDYLKSVGFHYESDYPYNAAKPAKGVCKNTVPVVGKISDYVTGKAGVTNGELNFYTMLKNGPIVAAMDAKDLGAYKSGILTSVYKLGVNPKPSVCQVFFLAVNFSFG